MRNRIGLAVMLFAASVILGGYGQKISYLLNDKVSMVPPDVWLVSLTALSIGGFILSAVLMYKAGTSVKNQAAASVMIVCGGVVSLWSIFIVAAWMG